MEMIYQGLGRCSCVFWLAVAFDVFGLLILLIGVFADVFFYDFLIYAGAIIIFLSLIWWVFWYTGNIEVPPEDLNDDVGLLKKEKTITGAVRRLSTRLSSGIRNSFRRNGEPPRGREIGAKRAAPTKGALTGDDKSQEPPPVAVAMVPYEDGRTVSAGVDGDLPISHTTTETSAI
ncbi:transmembrane protein 238 [Aplochiton taeniatus]